MDREETSVQTASQSYDCDDCDGIIMDETKYVRVAFLLPTSSRRDGSEGRSAWCIEKYHVECWQRLEHLAESSSVSG